MGCNVSPYRGGVPRLVETRALSTNIAAANTLYDFFVADDRCIVNITEISGATTGVDRYVLNDGTIDDYFATSNSSIFNDFVVPKAQGRLIANVSDRAILLLLEKGERIRIGNASKAHTHTATAYIYK